MPDDLYNLDLFSLWGKAQILAENFHFGTVLDVWKTAGFLATLIFAVLLMWVVLKSKERAINKPEEAKIRLNPSKSGEGKHNARWKEVRSHLESLREAEWKFAVIEADKMAETALAEAGFPGETMGERMTLISKDQLNSIDDLWQAHKLRNIIAHDPNHQVKYGEVRGAVEKYEKALRELGALG